MCVLCLHWTYLRVVAACVEACDDPVGYDIYNESLLHDRLRSVLPILLLRTLRTIRRRSLFGPITSTSKFAT